MSRKASVHSSGGLRTRPNPLASVIRGSLLVSAGFLLAQPGYIDGVKAGPQGGNVVGGQGAIKKPDSATTLIQQQSHSLAIDWQTFNVAQHELVQFNQPTSSAAVLNRVLNQSPSQIFGQINANGNVFISNGAGVFFSETARVNVGGLFATSLNIKNEDFMAGRYNFFADSNSPGGIVNKGLITAATGGFVILAGGSVANDGVIMANLGHVELAAGKTATLDFDGDGLIRFQVDGDILENAENVEDQVANTGTIEADGGTVKLTAQAAKDVFTRAVNNEGIIKAGRVERKGGKVMLAGLGAPVRNSGTVDVSAETPGEDGGEISITSDSVIEQYGTLTADAANGDGGTVTLESNDTTIAAGDSVTSARSASGQGGTVKLLGERVGLADNAAVDVSGETGGGTALVGGDFQGKNPEIRNASATYISPDAVVAANAGDSGDGGRVIIWANDATRFYGTVDARGGSVAGDGGFVEVSGKNYLDFAGTVRLGATNGVGGTLLLDPDAITITDDDTGGASQPDVNFDTHGTTPTSSITVGTIENTSAGENATITIQANDSITIENLGDGGPNTVSDETINLQDGVSLVLETRNSTADNDNPGGGIFFTDTNDAIETGAGGSITITAGTVGTAG
ncbi:MAG TPA: filamentous hemagglutinin N-terminal domain-containing protein, partial [Gammaproteobacteria bacterium]